VACTAFFLVIAYFYFPETKQKTLEEVAAAFGDKVVLVSDREVVDEQAILEGKAGFGHLESTPVPAKET